MKNIPGKTEKELNKEIERIKLKMKKDIECLRSFNQTYSISLIDKIKYFFKKDKNV